MNGILGLTTDRIMIQEQYVTFEVAKLLKEKDFNEEVRTYYDEFGKEHDLSDDFSDIKNTDIDAYPEFADSLDFHCTRPTQQMAMRWLREVHDIKIMIRPYVDGTYSYEILNGFWYVNFDSYEDAAEAAIKYCLNLI